MILGNYIKKNLFLGFEKLWKYYLISHILKLEIIRNVVVSYKILFLDFGNNGNVIWKL
jgi:hypothetical protein